MKLENSDNLLLFVTHAGKEQSIILLKSVLLQLIKTALSEIDFYKKVYIYFLMKAKTSLNKWFPFNVINGLWLLPKLSKYDVINLYVYVRLQYICRTLPK